MKHANERIEWDRLNKLGVEVSKYEADGAVMALFDVDEVSMVVAGEWDRQTAERNVAANLAMLEGLESGDRLILPNGDEWHFLVFMGTLRIGRSPGMSFAQVDVMLGWIDAAIRGGARVVRAGEMGLLAADSLKEEDRESDHEKNACGDADEQQGRAEHADGHLPLSRPPHGAEHTGSEA